MTAPGRSIIRDQDRAEVVRRRDALLKLLGDYSCRTALHAKQAVVSVKVADRVEAQVWVSANAHLPFRLVWVDWREPSNHFVEDFGRVKRMELVPLLLEEEIKFRKASWDGGES